MLNPATLAMILGLACMCLRPSGAQAANINSNHDRIWNFTDQSDGAYPRGDLLVDALYNIYGTTAAGGDTGNGAVFLLVPPPDIPQIGTLTTLYSFTGGADGSLPSGGLVEDANGAVYGTTVLDGIAGGGTVFQLVPPAQGQSGWTENTLWGFGTPGDGANPVGNLIFDPLGNLYGTTRWGGAFGFGTVFMLAPPVGGIGPWTETLLWSFTGGADGANPLASLILDSSGNVYGTTAAGGSATVGTVFQLAPLNDGSGTYELNTLWSFTGGTDGGSPTGTLFGGVVNANCDQARFPYYGEPNTESQYAEGAAYVPAGGNGCGVVFDISPSGGLPWTETVVWNFTAGLDGANPAAGLVADSAGNLYGQATEYGRAQRGDVFQLTPPSVQGNPWTETTLTSFDGLKQGFYARGTPAWGLGGRLYSSTTMGGSSWTHVSNYGFGEIFTSNPYPP
jgi:uncharacterized repeat protein (TIGR03803 family)